MYRNIRGNIASKLKGKEVLLFGCGVEGRRCANSLISIGVKLLGAYDNNIDLQGKQFVIGERDVCPILSFEDFKMLAVEKRCWIIIASKNCSNQIAKQLLDNGIQIFLNYEDIDFPINDGYYDKTYFQWQESIGQFGAQRKKNLFVPYIKESDKICEFGCGGGFLLDALPFPNENKIGVEINPYARDSCHKKGIKCEKELGKLEDESIDIVISTHALEHVYNPFGILEEVKKKLKSDGKAVFHVPYEYGEDCEYHRNDINNHVYTWTPLTFGNLFKCAGFFVDEVRTIRGVWPEKYNEILSMYGDVLFDELEILNGIIRSKQSILIVAYKND